SVIIDNKQALFLHFAYASEYGSAGKIVALQNNFNKQTDRGQIEKDLDEYRRIYGIELNDEQKNAVVSSMQNAVSVITGGPGTGKTTIIKCLIFLFNKRGESFNLMAPTGRAAKRINESTGEEAATIHRALKLTPGQSEQSSIQVGADNVIVDEVSMLDIFLFYSLLKCVRDGTRLILLGDSDQLPSVGAGNVLADLLQKLPKVCLTKIYRQDGGSLIIENAHKINGGQMPNLKSTDKDFFFIKRNKGIEVADEIVRLVSKRLPKYLGVTPDKIQVLCPMKNGPAGANNLNALLSAVLNPLNRPVIISGSTSFKEGDKVMQTSNNYSLEYQRGSEHGEGVFNGDMGVIESLDVATKELTVLFEDGKRAAYTDSIGELVLSYAITVHKSQGSEFEAVILPAILGSPLILTRNLLYTAITRARRLVVLVGEEYAVKRMVDNDYIARRNSGLSFFLEAAGKNYLRLFGEKG
ncbi:MAG: AAA family ATPase, partial [Firmicutes bacterium]|nr:AAA family ATPase [Bacillota bacterium]